MLTWTRIQPGYYRAGQWTVTRGGGTATLPWVLSMAGVQRGMFATARDAKAHAVRLVGSGR